MATATSRSRQQVSRRPIQQSSGWPLSTTQTLIVGGVAAITLLGCVIVAVAFSGKSIRPATQASVDLSTLEATKRWVQNIVRSNDYGQLRALRDRVVEWEIPVQGIDAVHQRVEFVNGFDPLYLKFVAGLGDNSVPSDIVLTQAEIKQGKEHLRWANGNEIRPEPPRLAVPSMRLKARIIDVFVREKGVVVATLTDLQRLP